MLAGTQIIPFVVILKPYMSQACDRCFLAFYIFLSVVAFFALSSAQKSSRTLLSATLIWRATFSVSKRYLVGNPAS